MEKLNSYTVLAACSTAAVRPSPWKQSRIKPHQFPLFNWRRHNEINIKLAWLEPNKLINHDDMATKRLFFSESGKLICLWEKFGYYFEIQGIESRGESAASQPVPPGLYCQDKVGNIVTSWALQTDIKKANQKGKEQQRVLSTTAQQRRKYNFTVESEEWVDSSNHSINLKYFPNWIRPQ